LKYHFFLLAQGILKLSHARDDKLKRVSLRVDEADITFALKVYTLHSLFIIPKMQFLKLTPSLFIARTGDSILPQLSSMMKLLSYRWVGSFILYRIQRAIYKKKLSTHKLFYSVM